MDPYKVARMTRPVRIRARAVLLGACGVMALASMIAPHPVHADTTPGQAPTRPALNVTPTTGLDPAGATVHVTGSGFDETRGVYIAFCVVPPAGMMPSPCGGGVDLAGSGGASQWISSNPPDYGDGLAQPYGPGGTFEVQVRVGAMLTNDIDCRKVQCAIVARSDHTRLSDRSLDVIVPVFFSAESESGAPVTAAPVQTAPATLPGDIPSPDANAPVAGQPGDVVPAPPSSSPGPLATTPTTTATGTTPVDEAEASSTSPPRGSAPTWPVWAGSAGAAAALVAIAPRRNRAASATSAAPAGSPSDGSSSTEVPR